MLFLLSVTPVMHAFWHPELSEEDKMTEMISFFKVPPNSSSHSFSLPPSPSLSFSLSSLSLSLSLSLCCHCP